MSSSITTTIGALVGMPLVPLTGSVNATLGTRVSGSASVVKEEPLGATRFPATSVTPDTRMSCCAEASSGAFGVTITRRFESANENDATIGPSGPVSEIVAALADSGFTASLKRTTMVAFTPTSLARSAARSPSPSARSCRRPRPW